MAEKTNPLATPRIAKVTVNIGVGEAGEKLQKAEKVLAELTGGKPVRTLGRTTNRELGVRKGGPIGCKVTLRGKTATEFLAKALDTRERRVPAWSFDAQGNLQFGVVDHTDFAGQKYNPEVGVFGMDVCITLEKPGHRIKHRAIATRRVPTRARVTPTESRAFLEKQFSLKVL